MLCAILARKAGDALVVYEYFEDFMRKSYKEFVVLCKILYEKVR